MDRCHKNEQSVLIVTDPMNQSKGKRQPQVSRAGRNSNANSVSRGITNEITGGSKDLKPQWLSFSATQSGTDTTTTTTQALPILRNFQTGGNRAQIIELLKVYFFMNVTSEQDSTLSVFLTTKSAGTTNVTFSDPTVVAAAGTQYAITTSGAVDVDLIRCMDLTDGAGNGVLVATDNIYAQVQSATTGGTNTVRIKLLYRITGASVTEYVGIVQSQQ